MTTVWARVLTIALIFSSQTSWANDIFLEAYGDSIELSLIQKNGQDNSLDLYISGDNNKATIVQDGNYNVVDIIQSGTEPTTTNIYQLGDNKNFTVNQYCTTQGGCSVTVTQN